MDLVRLKNEVESLREENVKLNKDRSALHDTKDKLQKQIKYLDKYSQEDGVIIKSQEKELISQEALIRKLKVDIDSLEKAYAELLELSYDKLDEMKEQQAIIECQKNDIERLVKLNSRLISKQEDLKGAFYSILNR